MNRLRPLSNMLQTWESNKKDERVTLIMDSVITSLQNNQLLNRV